MVIMDFDAVYNMLEQDTLHSFNICLYRITEKNNTIQRLLKLFDKIVIQFVNF